MQFDSLWEDDFLSFLLSEKKNKLC